jgi:pimeloyl-ACP methyl ester carboxylesterase
VNRLGIITSGVFELLKLTAEGLDFTKGTRLVPTGLLKTAYLKPKKWLESRGHQVHAFPYDWRRSIDSSAKLLHETIERIVSGDSTRQVVLVAHSMGGLVARRYFDLYGDQAEERVERLIMLGTPNHGSYVPLMAMKGNYTLLRLVSFIYGGSETCAIVQSFPGLYQMFPNASVFGQPDVYKASFWNDEGMPQTLLDSAQAFHASVKSRLPHKMVLIACRTRKTVTRLEREPVGDTWRFRFLGAAVGDGTVPFDSAFLRDIDTYETTAEHGSIQKDDDVLRALDEIVQDGKAGSLPPYKPVFGEADATVTLEEIEPVAPLLQL